MGVTPEETYKSLEETGTVEKVKSSKQETTENETISKLKSMGIDVSEDNESISNLTNLVNDEHFDKLSEETKEAAVKETQEQYVDSLRYSKKRKDKAVWFKGASGKKESYDHFKPKCWEVWKDLNNEQKEAVYKYTNSGYSAINDYLRGIDTNVDEVVKDRINLIDSVLDKSVMEEDCWLQRGVGSSGTAKFLDIASLGYSKMSEINDPDELIGLRPVEKGFMSCGSSRGTGILEDVTFNIFVPKGTHGMYLTPISGFGGGSGGKYKTWKGEDTYIGGENETLLNRGLRFEVTKAERKKDGITNKYIWFIDLEVITDNE